MPDHSPFGSFSWYCNRVKLPVCSLLGENDPKCYARNVSFGDFLLFQPAVIIVTIGSFLMTLIMLSNVKSKYTAVGKIAIYKKAEKRCACSFMHTSC